MTYFKSYSYKIIFCAFALLSFISTNAQVKISTIQNDSANPDPSAILDLAASDKGFSIPTVTLLSETDAETIKTPKKGLMVYHKEPNTLPEDYIPIQEGVYYNTGTSQDPIWTKLNGVSSLDGTPVDSEFGPFSEERKVGLDFFEARLKEDTDNGNKKRVQLKATVTENLSYYVMTKEFVQNSSSNGEYSIGNCSGTISSTSFNWISCVSALDDSKNELNEIWIYITTSGYEGAYRLMTHMIHVNGKTETGLVLKKF